VSTKSDAERFLSAEIRHVPVGAAEIAYRVFGEGEPILFLHGWPLSGFTYRRLIPRLSGRYRCYAADSAGAGETRWQAENDFSFRGHAENYLRFVDGLGLGRFHVVAHNTGATIARALALKAGDRIGRMALIGTEIPGHRPPFIPLFQRLTGLPGALTVFRALLGSRLFLRSPMGFGGCFEDKRLIEGEFEKAFVEPMRRDPRRLEGQIRYLRGIDWGFVDDLAEEHAKIRNPVLWIWGENDPTFPISRARVLESQLPDCRGFRVIPAAKLLVHEERPEEVAEAILAFLS
jgi:haloalkane dehalogenase